ncbi:MAG TPA: hypothetical protein VHZ51_07825 [Ktedonobacteraceae bacterium]|jgi:hypothetical protein|nr:hypothetical protein [Ktedonobacteraceae bacterium]
MEDIVAVRVELQDGTYRFFLTWGRIQERVDPEPLEQLIFDHCEAFDLGGTPIKASLCCTLQEAISAPYFYEYFFMMGQQTIPFGKNYNKWRKQMDKKMRDGKELYYLGNSHRFRERSPG